MGATGININRTVDNKSAVATYDISDKALQRGYSSASQMIAEDLITGGFSRSESEMLQEAEDLGYVITNRPNGEYFTVADDRDTSDTEFNVYYVKAGTTYSIERVEEV